MALRSAPRQATPRSSAPDSCARAAHSHQHCATHAKSAHAQCTAAHKHNTACVRTRHRSKHCTCVHAAPARAATRALAGD
eukprot:4926936-Prymnesium_polylepis.1